MARKAQPKLWIFSYLQINYNAVDATYLLP